MPPILTALPRLPYFLDLIKGARAPLLFSMNGSMGVDSGANAFAGTSSPICASPRRLR